MKYYYDCPIEAAYMNINFGFKYEDGIYLEVDFADNDIDDGLPIFYSCSDQPGRKIYLHTESIKLLNPQTADYVFKGQDNYCDECKINIEEWSSYSDERAKDYNWEKKVIFRNGKSFIMPKVEI